MSSYVENPRKSTEKLPKTNDARSNAKKKKKVNKLIILKIESVIQRKKQIPFTIATKLESSHQ